MRDAGGNDWRGFAVWAAGPLALPPLAAARAHDAVIDTVACIAAGAGTPAARAAEGQPAEFRWAVAAHALDFDDYDRPSVGHPSAVLVPVVLARAASGREALAAYVAGLEAIDRLGEMMNPEHYEAGWHATATLGAIGAAVAAGRLRGLDGARMLTAMSLAAGVASGLKAQFGSMAKPVGAGFAALHGVMAADLAAAGADARTEALDAFVHLHCPAPRPLGRWGSTLAIEEHGLVVKLWPCCGYLGRIVPAALELAPDIAGGIEEVTVTAPPRNARVLAYAIPGTPDEARFSAPYCVATALLTGRLGPADFTDEAIRRTEILALARRVRLVESTEPQSPVDLSPDDPDRIEIRLSGGPALARTLRDLPGSPETPATRVQLLAKLRDCGGAGAEPLLLAFPDTDTAPLRRWLESLP